MTKHSFLFVVACALIDADNRVLLAKRPEGKSLAGLYEFPGGKVELGETPEHALIRELQEELDISIQEKDLEALTFVSHAYEKFHLFMPLYICRKFKGIAKGIEGQEIAWVGVDALDDYKMPAADYPLLLPLKKSLLL